MSTLAKDLLEAQGQIETLKASLATLTSECDALKASVEDLGAKLKAEQEGRTADAAAHKKAIDAEMSAHADTKNALAETKNALTEANTKLADPAYQMASAKGSEKPVAEGGQAAADAPKTREQLEAEYKKIDGSTVEGARARAEFRAKYKNELGL